MEKIKRLISEAIKLELNMSKLYETLSKEFEEDEDFFWQLSKEEIRHSSLIKSTERYFMKMYDFPKDLLPVEVKELEKGNKWIEKLIKRIKKDSISRKEAFNEALNLENSAGELHFQNFIEKNINSEIHKIFVKLNKADKDHSLRIEEYMNDNNIKIDK